MGGSALWLVDQGGGPQRLPGRLAGQPLLGRPAQLAVDQWEQLLGEPGVAERAGLRSVARFGLIARGCVGPARARSGAGQERELACGRTAG
jgi:hypothetical protein